MRWFASAFALALMMALFPRLTAGGALEARATLALGFLLLAAQLGGEVARRTRLPRLTGYLLTGFAVGPAWLGLVRADEVGALRFIADAAAALIAFAAGSELRLGTLRAERRGLTRLASGAILFPFAAVTAVMFTVGLWFPVTVHQPVGDRLAVALVLGTVAAASSPVVTMALIGELEARGPVARTVLAITVVQDVAVIVLLALVLAVARLLTSAGALKLLVAGTALAHLVGSVAVGAALGYALAAYVRQFQRHTALLLVAAAFVAAESAQLVHLETVLVALTAGFAVENFFPVEGERLRGPLRRGSLPLYLVFFALAGAGLRLEALASLWPWVLLVAGLRVVAMRYGVVWAGQAQGRLRPAHGAGPGLRRVRCEPVGVGHRVPARAPGRHGDAGRQVVLLVAGGDPRRELRPRSGSHCAVRPARAGRAVPPVPARERAAALPQQPSNDPRLPRATRRPWSTGRGSGRHLQRLLEPGLHEQDHRDGHREAGREAHRHLRGRQRAARRAERGGPPLAA